MLKKADPQKRSAFMERFQTLYEQVCLPEVRLVYVDEAYIHRDIDLGCGWVEKNRIAWRISDFASLSYRINWYGALSFSM